jgi:mannose/cellobiose epimerase-like protein (N-acyl-D-glucosamine 2-epimerase family)
MTGHEAGAWARGWLFEAALPLWLERGADHRHGGWFDKLDQDAVPLPGPKRLRVQARQAFVFAESARLGWSGDWRTGLRQGLDFMLAHYRRDDGLFRSAVDREGAPVSDTVDLYDQAFVLFALAAAYRALGKPVSLRAEAIALLGRLGATLAHPRIGFEEAMPRVLPLRSNPHMHLLEAMLAWIDAGERGPFESVARAIVDLAETHLIDPATGAIGEVYDGDWQSAGDLREPGHQFEWAYLLDACTARLGGDHGAAVRRLIDFANRHGVIDGLTIYALDAQGRVLDGRARLWAQTERLRTMTIMGEPATDSLDALRRFLAVPVAGLWHDWIDAQGRLVIEPVPTSSLYHIVTGLAPLIEPAPILTEKSL